MNREYRRWYSPSVNRDMELLVFGHAGAKVLVFPTREGRFYDYENWGQVSALAEPIEQGHLQLFCVDSIDHESLYCRWIHTRQRIERHVRFEQYISDEVVPLMRERDRNAFLIAHGCSVGAYHALNIALRHPGVFGKVVGLSGRYDLTREIGNFRDLFDGYYDEDIYFHTPNHFLPQLNDCCALAKLRKTEITLGVGETDPFRDSNEELSRALWSKGIWNQLSIWEGEGHRPHFWRRLIRGYL